MTCASCRRDNPAGAKFCAECGARLALACPACSAPNAATNKFCSECGAKLAPISAAAASPSPAAPAEHAPAAHERFASPHAYTPPHLADKILASKSAIEGERKLVTVLFVDVCGFTTISEKLDPEDVHAIMDRAFEVMLEAVHRYEGTINQFLGDGIMALFGAPIAHEDHAHRALGAALGIREGLKPLQDDVRRTFGVEFRVRMGINTGLVVVGAIGRDLRMDYTAVGDTTNLTARLMSLAQPEQIVVSGRTQRLRAEFFRWEDLGEFQVKGKSEPVHAHALVSEIRGRTRLEVSRERGLTALAGRRAELDRLLELYRSATEGTGTTVLVVGEPGVGKSRLLYELLVTIEPEGVLELETTCVPYGRSIPYRPILELFRRYLGLFEEMDDEAIGERVDKYLAALDMEGEEPATLLAHFLGVSAPEAFLNRLGGAQLKERTLALLCEIVRRASRSAPLVVVVENVHWIDASSEEFLTRLADAMGEDRILLLLTSRAGVAPPSLVERSAATVTLEGLAADDVRRMVTAVLRVPAVSEALLQMLLEKSAGNPLYVEEIVRQLQETNGLVVDGEAGLARPDITVPATIHDIIAARVDRLGDDAKRALQGAAVIGRRFGVSLLSRVLGIPADVAARYLAELHRLDFVFPSDDDPEPMYSFKHALTQDVVYAGILERRRREYHAATGFGLEELYAGNLEPVVELIAYQFGRSAEAEKAVDYGILAGEKAQRRWANAEAIAYFEAALKRLDGMPDVPANRLRRIDGVVKQAETMFALGRHAEHIKTLEAVRTLVDETADPPRGAAWYFWTGFFHSLTGAPPHIPIGYCTRAIDIADTPALADLRASAECALTHVYVIAGELGRAISMGERALAAFEARGNVWWACRALWGLGIATMYAGAWNESLGYCRRAIEYGTGVNDRRLRVVGWWRKGWTHVQRGDAEAALRCCEEALALSPSPFDATNAKATQGYGWIKAGAIDHGIAQLEECVVWFEKSRLPMSLASFAVCLGEGYLRQGRVDDARRIFTQVLATSREAGYRHFEGISQRLLGESLVSQDPAAAAANLDAALAILEKIGTRNEVAKTLAAQGELQRAGGDVEGARRTLRRALDLFETLGTLDAPVRVRAALESLPAPAGG